MATRRKKKQGTTGTARKSRGDLARRKGKILIMIVIAGVLLLVIFLFVGNYLYGPPQILSK